MSKIQSPEKITDVPKALVKNMIFLATSGFGVVVALAWNEFIKAGIDQYIAPYFKDGSILSLFIYATVVTVVAVLVIMQLSSFEKKLNHLETLLMEGATARNTPKKGGKAKK